MDELRAVWVQSVPEYKQLPEPFKSQVRNLKDYRKKAFENDSDIIA